MMGRVEEPPPDTQFNAGETLARNCGDGTA